MRISRIEIQNFRSIRHAVVDFGDTTVLVGPNNAGKTAILDALRIALTSRWGQRGTGFSEYDIHIANDKSDPKTSSGVIIKLTSEEQTSGEWPEALVGDLSHIVQIDQATNLRSITLKAEYRWNADADSFEPSWEFLDANREPLVGDGARRNLDQFRRYLPIFYLGALRDVEEEFSSRSSQFWRRMLKDLNIPEEFESQALQDLDRLNQQLLKADPRLAEIAETLSGATQVASRDGEGGLKPQMVPLKTWDLLSRAEIILRNESDQPWLPLTRQGQGIQSLSVIFLFQAFVDHLLAKVYEPDSQPVLALEEPETHLHPQAVRTLWDRINALPGQKIVTTHSPYFVQHVPFRDLRLVRLTKDDGTTVQSLPSSFSVSFPPLDGLNAIVENSKGLVAYEKSSKTLTVYGSLDKNRYHSLLKCSANDKERRSELEVRLRDLKDQSALHVTDKQLRALETSARRLRGEIFFAERWLIVEGQTDYLLVHAIAHAKEYNLDQYGVSVIDAMNNGGQPATFAVLARALDIPWLAVFDGDDAGLDYIEDIRKQGFSKSEVEKRCRFHLAGDLEAQLVADGVGPELREILAAIEVPNALELNDEELQDKLGRTKTAYSAQLAAQIRCEPLLADRMLVAFRETIAQLRELT